MSIATRRIAYLALLTALTVVLGYLEAMIPLPVTIPGVKLGLANITVLIALYLMGPRYAFALTLMKVAVTSLLVGSPSMILFSAAGSILAFAGMWVLWRTDKVNVLVISVAAAILHNIGQLTVAIWVMNTLAILINLPIMIIAACITGTVTGMVARTVIEVLPPVGSEKKKSREISIPEYVQINPALEFKDVSYCYPGSEIPALQNVSFTVAKGQRVALLGANGSGKSTVAHLSNGMLFPDQGAVFVDSSTSEESLQSRVGMVAQDPDMQIIGATVIDDTAFGLENIGTPSQEIDAQALRALTLMELSGQLDRDPNTLSGGEKQRLVIAGAIAMDPDYLVFDEPSSMLDACGRAEVLEAINTLHKNGRGILHITHDLDEAAAADKIIVLEKGSIVFEGAPHQLIMQQSLLEKLGFVESPFLQMVTLLRQAGAAVPSSQQIGVSDWVGTVEQYRKERG